MSDSETSLSVAWIVAIVFIALFTCVVSYVIITCWKRYRSKRRNHRSSTFDRQSRYYELEVPLDSFAGSTGFSPIVPERAAAGYYGRDRRVERI